MPSSTFLNLPQAKKERINAALLNEFSAHPLADAQVARIIKDAKISRGAYYKYFITLKGGYDYMRRMVLSTIHRPFAGKRLNQLKPADYVNAARSFLEDSSESEYFEFIQMDILHNQKNLDDSTIIQLPSKRWAITILCHETIKEAMEIPDDSEKLLQRLQISLEALS